VERVADVEITGAVFEVVRGEQDLGGVVAVGLEGFVVSSDQSGLTGCGGGLDVRKVAGAPLQLQQPDAGTDGSAGDDDDSRPVWRIRRSCSARRWMRSTSSVSSGRERAFVPILTTTA
jgi:hypothetical protein